MTQWGKCQTRSPCVTSQLARSASPACLRLVVCDALQGAQEGEDAAPVLQGLIPTGTRQLLCLGGVLDGNLGFLASRFHVEGTYTK